MRIALVQLPLLDPSYSAVKANVPLASGYIVSYLLANYQQHSNDKKPEILIAPRGLVDFGGDSAVIEWIAEGDFDIVGFTCYMWNIERNLWLAGKIKIRQPRIVIIAGGPEITEDCPWLNCPDIDTFVTGEGEESFLEYVYAFASGKPVPKLIRITEPVNLAKIPNPYVSGILSHEAADPFHIETMRGCGFSCTYCYYSKTRFEPRFFPEERIGRFFEYAREKRASEIYVMDPSFVCRPHIEERLKLIKDANISRIPLHTELNLEFVDETIARLLGDAGFVSIEAGLQSTNPAPLKAVKRYFNEEKFIRGASLIAGQHIAIRTGIIIGLPLDTLGGFSATLDFIADNGLADGVEIYPLSILPGTQLRKEAIRFGIEYMGKPPYRVLKTNSMIEEDFFSCGELVCRKLGLDLFHRIYPHFSGRCEYSDIIDTNNCSSLVETAANPAALGNNCTIILDESHIRNNDELSKLAATFRRNNPFACIQLVVRSDSRIDDNLARDASDLFFEPSHYMERVHNFDDDIQGRFSTRVFQLTRDKSVLLRMLESDSFADPVFHYSPGTLHEIDPMLAQELPLIVIPQNTPENEIRSIRQIYEGNSEYIL